jgi:hypothetical protein
MMEICPSQSEDIAIPTSQSQMDSNFLVYSLTHKVHTRSKPWSVLNLMCTTTDHTPAAAHHESWTHSVIVTRNLGL